MTKNYISLFGWVLFLIGLTSSFLHFQAVSVALIFMASGVFTTSLLIQLFGFKGR